MCELYVKADPILYESRSRSLRIRGVVTTLRLENQFWDILTEIAGADSVSTNQLIAKLYEEVMDYRGEVVNFASFLRVSCTRYLSQKQVTNRVVPLSIAAG
ncbi:ribbon-helix-helix domain-containing protein [Pseudomonas sp. SAS7]|uniref:ribbon-helix-helix domain-containing protein n=1 Tax=Pseudomonas sp. SAS7 TaxID=3156487 RepID=UPI003F99F7A4